MDISLVSAYLTQFSCPRRTGSAFIIGEEFIGDDHYVAMILGDNIFAGHGLKKRLLRAANKQDARYGIWLLCVDDPGTFWYCGV